MSKNREYLRRKWRNAAKRRREKCQLHPELAEKQKDVARQTRLKKYGLTVDAYEERFFQQEGKCAGCLREPSQDRRLGVYFDKNTQSVHGLLCLACFAILRASWGSYATKSDRLIRLGQFLASLESKGGGREGEGGV